MDQRRFDTVAKFLADRKLTRREALAQTGTGIAAGALATAGLSVLTSSPAAAQGATPAATPQSPTALKPLQTPMLFVQSFQSGTAEAIGTDGTKFKVTLEKGLGQTIYFSDRPERVVGAMPTGDFLDTLGFMPDNPPNAAILVEVDEGQTDFAVVELFSPQYDPATANLTYEATVLDDWNTAEGTSLQHGKLDTAPTSFGATHNPDRWHRGLPGRDDVLHVEWQCRRHDRECRPRRILLQLGKLRLLPMPAMDAGPQLLDRPMQFTIRRRLRWEMLAVELLQP
ncbi:MAG: hypothetical protein ACR2OU_13395 [Thermomicrobiales bacterium]